MVRKYQKRPKRGKVFLILIFITAIALLIILKPHQLKEKGYSNYRDIEAKLSKQDIDLVVKYEYNPHLSEIILDTNYQNNNLERYLKYSKDYPDFEGKNIIRLVNHDFDKQNVTYEPIILELMDQEYYLSKNLERYLSYSKKHKYSAKDIVANVNCHLDYAFYTNVKDADLSKGFLVLTSKYYRLSSTYKPDDLVTIDSQYGSWGSVRSEVYNALIKINKDTKELGYSFYTTSPFRDYNTQEVLYNRYVKNNGLEYALRSSAKPGHSEHQTGLVLDLTNGTNSIYNFESTPESKWLQKNAHKYGFILRYPKDKEYLTGFKYEPWHYRYVGIEAATYIYEHNITFDEYYAYFVENS